MNKETNKGSSVFSKLKKHFITGLLFLAPTIVTLWVLKRAFLIFDGILGEVYRRFVFGPFDLPTPPGLGAVTLIAIIILVGWSARFYVGKKLFEIWDDMINSVPIINKVYIAVRQLANTLKEGSGIVFQQPVLVQFPRQGLFSVGFITRHYTTEIFNGIGSNVVSVFIPTTPNPTTGFIMFVPENDVTPLKMSIEDAMKFIMSAGTVSPDTILTWQKEDR